jgi:hypothetical protein
VADSPAGCNGMVAPFILLLIELDGNEHVARTITERLEASNELRLTRKMHLGVVKIL